MSTSFISPMERDPELLFHFSSKHHSVLRLLNSSLTEIFPPAPPNLSNVPPAPLALLSVSTTSSTTSLSVDPGLAVKDHQDFVVKDNLIVHESRCLVASTSCSCFHLKQNDQSFSGWDSNDSMPFSHLIVPNISSPEPAKNENNLTKSSSTSKIEVSKVFQGYPYKKAQISFHFQHFEGEDVAADHAKVYKKGFTYPNMEDQLKSTSTSDYSSFSAPSVIEPKLLMLGVSKPGVAEPHRPSYNRQGYKFYRTPPMNYHSSRKTPDSSTAHLHHAFNSPAAKSTPVLEVHHGQASNDCHFIKLPLPSTPDSPPSAHQTSPQKYAWLDDRTNAYQFKDIINIEDTHPVIESQKKPSVRWASHRFPVSLVPSASRDTSTSAAHSPRQRQQYSGNVQVQRLRASSLPRGKDMQAQYNTDVPVPCQLLDLSGSKISPKTKSSSAKSQRYENGGGLRVHQEGTDHNTAAHAQWATLQRARRNRSRQQGPPVSLMPTSKALVPTLGVYSRAGLAQPFMDVV